MAQWWLKNRQWVLQLAGTLLAVGLLAVLVREEGWAEIVGTFKQIKVLDLIYAACLFLIARVAAAGRWQPLLRSAGIPMSFKDNLRLTFTSFFASHFLPTTVGGDLARLAGAIRMGYDRAVCLASIAADRLIGMLGMSLLAPIGLIHAWSLFQAGSLATVAPLKHPLRFLRRTASIFTIWLKRPSALLTSLFFSMVNILCQCAAVYIFASDLGSRASFWMVAGLWSLTYFVTLMPISVNGYGLQELSFTFFMSRVADLTPAVSLSVALLIRIFFLVSSLPGAFFLPAIFATVAEQKKDIPSEDILL